LHVVGLVPVSSLPPSTSEKSVRFSEEKRAGFRDIRGRTNRYDAHISRQSRTLRGKFHVNANDEMSLEMMLKLGSMQVELVQETVQQK
jgi:hypothetical protein